MYSFDTQLRVRYGETDQMGYLYYGNYAQYFEVGRVETMRSLGIEFMGFGSGTWNFDASNEYASEIYPTSFLR